MSVTMSRKLGSVPDMARFGWVGSGFYTPSVVLGAPAIAIALGAPRLGLHVSYTAAAPRVARLSIETILGATAARALRLLCVHDDVRENETIRIALFSWGPSVDFKKECFYSVPSGDAPSPKKQRTAVFLRGQKKRTAVFPVAQK